MAETTTTLTDAVNTTFKVQYFHISDDAGSGGSPTVDGSGSGIKSGRFGDNSVFRTMILLQMPKAYDVYSTSAASAEDIGYIDTDITVTNVEFVIKTVASGTGDADTAGPHILRHLPQFPKNASMDNGQGLPTFNALERTSGTVVQKKYFDGTDLGSILTAIDDSTDFGYGATGVIDYILPRTANTEFTINLKNFVKKNNLTWGDRVAFILEKENNNSGLGEATHANIDNDGIVGQNGWSTTQSIIDNLTAMNVNLTFLDPPPTRPVIELTPDTDLISGVLKLTTKPPERDIISLTTKYTTGTPTTIGNGQGVVYSGSSNRQSNFAINKDTLSQADGEIKSPYLANEGTRYNIVVFAEDNVNKVSSNMISHTRMSCTGSVSPSPPTIGQTATLTVSGFSDAGNSSAKEFVKVGVNWDGNATATNDTLEDYDIITLDSPASSTTLTHTYDKSKNAYKVNVFVVDEKGFRSDFTQAASLNVAEGTPVAKLRLSKETVMVGDQADELSVVTASAAQSYTVGSDKQIFAYLFGCTGTNIDVFRAVTTYPTANDNTGFSEASKKVRLKANIADCDGTIIRVYGRISVDASGGNIVDTDSSFSHYEQKVIELNPHATADKSFTDSGWVDGTNSSSEFFKSVEFINSTRRDQPDDATNVYYSLGDTSGNIINNQIRLVEEDTSGASWGGYVHANAGMTSLNINGSNNTITRGAGSTEFISNGLAVGDKIYISAPEDAENNSYFTVTALTTTVITVAETLTTNTDDTSAAIYKVNGPTISFTAVDEMTATIDCIVKDSYAAQTASSDDINTSAAVTQDVKFKEIAVEQYLDFDTISDAGEISIQAANLSRSGGLASNMALGNSRYPTNAFRTKLGKPVLQVQLRILTQAGYRKIWSLIEGDRYIFSTIDLKKVDSPAAAYKQVKLRLENGTINKDPSMASQYVASLNFVIIGELYDLSGLTA
tara:strand:+ start:1150 stop:4011 length:2862 start_codon:yes stop_codon:yes gene_type:complete